ncbi:hypothetical protein GCM10010873_26580 [Cypionkella aquatica]|uniref:Bacteriophage tail tape measure N-terminal domain-containing protein n=1 Tax=Cypionkella aquatica TaxID=1756042 RepID=A0AA37U4Z1_9RHOB|nr:hypothetical protein [Cypionkella aquatica]GLS87684.1 hypothetical protein GCM10010873_26580 [Cypionkella aquatica]
MAKSDEQTLLVRMEASLAKFENQMKAGYAAADKFSNQIEGRLGGMNKKVTGSAEASANAIGREMDALRAKYDPLFAASKRYEDELNQINRAWKVGAITAGQHGAAVDRLNKQYMSTGKQLVDVGDKALTGGNHMRMAMMQLSQVGQQTMASGNFVQALAIQLPDLGLAFGAAGAAAGLLAGVALPMLVSAFDGVGGSAKEVQDALSDLGDSTQTLRDVTGVSIADLRAQYGELTASVLEALVAQQKLALSSADATAKTAVTALGSEYVQVGEQVQILMDKLAKYEALDPQIAGFDVADQIQKTQEAIAAFEASVGLSRDKLVQLGDAVKEFSEADGIRAQADALGGVTAAIQGTSLATSEYAQQVNAAQLALYEAADAADDLKVSMADAATTAASLASSAPGGSWMDGAISSVKSLVDWLAQAVGLKNALGGPAATVSNAKQAADFKLAGAYGLYADTRAAAPDTPVVHRDTSKKGGGGSKKAPVSAMDKGEADLQRIQREIDLLGRSTQEVAALRAEWAMLDAAKKAGVDLDKKQAGSSKTLREEIKAQAQDVADLTLQLETQKISQQRFEQGIDGISDAMSQALVNGKKLREGLASVFKGIALDLAKSGIKQGLMALLNGANGGAVGGLGGLNAGVLGGSTAASYDGGGYTGNGARSGGVDGKGGFPAILHPRETVVDHTKGQGGGAVRVIGGDLMLTDDGHIMARVKVIAGGAVQQGLKSVPDIMDNHSKRKR